jgi:Rrf2 family protein
LGGDPGGPRREVPERAERPDDGPVLLRRAIDGIDVAASLLMAMVDIYIHHLDPVQRDRGARWGTMRRMNFSATTTHALRATAWLAAHPGEDAVLGRDLARKLRLPPDYLSKVLATLARSGVLRASRGARGGYRLARAPERIKLVDVVLPFEGTRARSRCLLRPDRPCRDSGACSAHASWARVNEAYRDFLERTTVADIQDSA